MRRILVVDDEPASRLAMVDLLEAEGHRVSTAEDAPSARQELDTGAFDLVLMDLVLPGVEGLELLDRALARDPMQRVVMITGHGSVESAVTAMQRGAFHYLTKPVKAAELRAVAAKALEDRSLREENQELRRRLDEVAGLPGVVGISSAWNRILALVRRVAPTDSTVLLTGESGTGKEIVASALHSLSRRAKRPFVKVNCAALVESLLQSELFGHARGSFTGAVADKKGRFERADGGTLFLDEIAEMSPETQARLLRVLQDGMVEPVGSETAIRVDVRVIAATNKNLEAQIGKGLFREDLYYRLKVVRLELPPLRERPEDIPILVHHFLGQLEAKYGLGVTGIEPVAMERIRAWSWPGNVRELENCLEGAIVTCAGSRLRVEDLPREIQAASGSPASTQVPVGVPIEELERQAILGTLERVGGNRALAADQLGISLRTLQRKLKQYRGEDDTPEPEEDS